MKYLAIISVCFLAACTPSQKLLMQTWRVTDVVFLDSLNTITEKQKKILTYNLKKDMQFSFLPDSAYQVKNVNDVINGKWWLSKNKKSLFTTNQQGIMESKIYELKKDQLKFESKGDFNQSFVFTCVPLTTGKK